MRKILIINIFIVLILPLQAQETIRLVDCLQQAELVYPGMKANSFYEQMKDLKQQLNKLKWGPQLNLNAQATYQSDVTSIDLSALPFPVDVPSPTNDQYKATLDINQLLWNGGALKKMQELTRLELSLNNQSTMVELFAYKENICNIYLSVSLLQQQEKIIELSKEILHEQLKKLLSGVEHGIVLQSQADILKSEIIKLEQSEIELSNQEKSLIESLEILCGISMDQSNRFDDYYLPLFAGISGRPEIYKFNLQQAVVEKNAELISKRKMPKLYAFGQAGYGRPGLNFLNNEFEPFYLVGAVLNWNIWDWNQNRYERESVLLQKQLIETRKATFNQGNELALGREKNNLAMYKDLIAKNMELIELREKISKTVAKQLSEGVITASEYLLEFNAEKMARLKLEINKIKERQAEIKQEILLGNL
ncbi:MAG: TolC family protein [Bacteroidetes bacterium]|nr:TolC family protein [Bacteroidota bacterium]